MIALNITPTLQQWPDSGGVREHLRLLHKAASQHPKIVLVDAIRDAVCHVESAYVGPKPLPDVYVCHGGFTPHPMRVVYQNLDRARIIISVSKWLAKRYFPQLAAKTAVIHNGIDLSEWANITELESPYEPGYVFYGKEWVYSFVDFIRLVHQYPSQHFVTLVWPDNVAKPDNVTVTGRLPKKALQAVLASASMLILTGTEVCPTMLFEAWACGVPVLASQDPYPTGAAEIMISSSGRVYGGVLYTSQTLFEAFERCREAQYDLGVEGYMEVVSRFEWKDKFEEYVQVYERLQAVGTLKAA